MSFFIPLLGGMLFEKEISQNNLLILLGLTEFILEMPC